MHDPGGRGGVGKFFFFFSGSMKRERDLGVWGRVAEILWGGGF